MALPRTEGQRATRRAKDAQKRQAARLARQAARDAMDHTPLAENPPVLVTHDAPWPLPDALPPVAPASVAPTLAPLPDGLIPAHQPFRYATTAALSPADLDAITTFHAQYMQGGGLQAHLQALPPAQARAYLSRAQLEATYVQPLMQQQYTLACVGVDGAASQEAQSVQANLAWITQLLALEG